jgi:hypothetical protein
LRLYLRDEWKAYAPDLSVDMLFERLLEHLGEVATQYDPQNDRAAHDRAGINAIRNFLEEKHHENAQIAAKKMTEEGARRFYDRTQNQPGLDTSERAHLSAALRATREELEE